MSRSAVTRRAAVHRPAASWPRAASPCSRPSRGRCSSSSVAAEAPVKSGGRPWSRRARRRGPGRLDPRRGRRRRRLDDEHRAHALRWHGGVPAHRAPPAPADRDGLRLLRDHRGDAGRAGRGSGLGPRRGARPRSSRCGGTPCWRRPGDAAQRRPAALRGRRRHDAPDAADGRTHRRVRHPGGRALRRLGPGRRGAHAAARPAARSTYRAGVRQGVRRRGPHRERPCPRARSGRWPRRTRSCSSCRARRDPRVALSQTSAAREGGADWFRLFAASFREIDRCAAQLVSDLRTLPVLGVLEPVGPVRPAPGRGAAPLAPELAGSGARQPGPRVRPGPRWRAVAGGHARRPRLRAGPPPARRRPPPGVRRPTRGELRADGHGARRARGAGVAGPHARASRVFPASPLFRGPRQGRRSTWAR